MDDNLPVLIGARSKKSVARERARQQMERSRSNSRGRSILSRRTGGSAAELDMDDESTPIRPRTESVSFINTPIGMGPATTLMSPRRYSELGAVGVELTTEPAGAAALPVLRLVNDIMHYGTVYLLNTTTIRLPTASSWTPSTWYSTTTPLPLTSPPIKPTILPQPVLLEQPG